jgi:hypothetical protein
MLMTTVIKTTSVATKLRASSWRMEEWNNIAVVKTHEVQQKFAPLTIFKSIAWTLN